MHTNNISNITPPLTKRFNRSELLGATVIVAAFSFCLVMDQNIKGLKGTALTNLTYPLNLETVSLLLLNSTISTPVAILHSVCHEVPTHLLEGYYEPTDILTSALALVASLLATFSLVGFFIAITLTLKNFADKPVLRRVLPPILKILRSAKTNIAEEIEMSEELTHLRTGEEEEESSKEEHLEDPYESGIEAQKTFFWLLNLILVFAVLKSYFITLDQPKSNGELYYNACFYAHVRLVVLYRPFVTPMLLLFMNMIHTFKYIIYIRDEKLKALRRERAHGSARNSKDDLERRSRMDTDDISGTQVGLTAKEWFQQIREKIILLKQKMLTELTKLREILYSSYSAVTMIVFSSQTLGYMGNYVRPRLIRLLAIFTFAILFAYIVTAIWGGRFLMIKFFPLLSLMCFAGFLAIKAMFFVFTFVFKIIRKIAVVDDLVRGKARRQTQESEREHETAILIEHIWKKNIYPVLNLLSARFLFSFIIVVLAVYASIFYLSDKQGKMGHTYVELNKLVWFSTLKMLNFSWKFRWLEWPSFDWDLDFDMNFEITVGISLVFFEKGLDLWHICYGNESVSTRIEFTENYVKKRIDRGSVVSAGLICRTEELIKNNTTADQLENGQRNRGWSLLKKRLVELNKDKKKTLNFASVVTSALQKKREEEEKAKEEEEERSRSGNDQL